MIYNEAIECASRENLKNLQSERLVKVVKYIYDNSPVYKQKFNKLGIVPTDIKNVAEIHVSSGTTGNPTVVGYTKRDLNLWANVAARSIACAGGNKTTVCR